MMSNTKSYVCPVCGRALSSPGSLGRHLLIHSEDRLSNCAVCGTRFTDTNNVNRLASTRPYQSQVIDTHCVALFLLNTSKDALEIINVS